MTTEPNELTASINHKRMPVLLSDPADFETWVSGGVASASTSWRSILASGPVRDVEASQSAYC